MAPWAGDFVSLGNCKTFSRDAGRLGLSSQCIAAYLLYHASNERQSISARDRREAAVKRPAIAGRNLADKIQESYGFDD
jgi:hypothetical protein